MISSIKDLDYIVSDVLLTETGYLPVGNAEELIKGELFVVDSFLSPDECDELLFYCNSRTEPVSFGEHKRNIVMDADLKLCETISDRIRQSVDLDRLNAKPYGFNQENIEWDHKNFKINECMRFNRYENNSFDWHRDNSITKSDIVKSNYSVIIYLNDNYEGGELKVIKKKSNMFSGQTIVEEIEQFDLTNDVIYVKPKPGTLVLISQRLIHSTNICCGVKCVLRTDLIISGSPKANISETEMEIYNATRNLFLCAERDELNMTGSPKELYERFINLRQYPHRLTEVPSFLREYSSNETVNREILESLTFIGVEHSRGTSYNFRCLGDSINLLYMALMYVVLSYSENHEMFVERFREIAKNYKVTFVGRHRLSEREHVFKGEEYKHGYDDERKSGFIDMTTNPIILGSENIPGFNLSYPKYQDTDEFNFSLKDVTLQEYQFSSGDCSNCEPDGECEECRSKAYIVGKLLLNSYNVEMKYGDHDITLKDIENDSNGVISGVAIVTGLRSQFNHAACNHYDMSSQLSDEFKDDLMLKCLLKFSIDGDRIKIYFTPEISL